MWTFRGKDQQTVSPRHFRIQTKNTFISEILAWFMSVYIFFLSTCERKHCTSQNGKTPLVSHTSILRRVSRGETQHNSAVQHPDAGGVVRGSDTSPHEHTERRRRRVSESSERQTDTQTDVSSPTVVASYAYHVFVVVRETDVGHVGRVTEVTLVFGLLRN